MVAPATLRRLLGGEEALKQGRLDEAGKQVSPKTSVLHLKI